jgi:hypothetical protein
LELVFFVIRAASESEEKKNKQTNKHIVSSNSIQEETI